MSKKKKAKKLFPEVVFVTFEDGGADTEFLCVGDSADSADNGQMVARYALVSVATMRVTKELV